MKKREKILESLTLIFLFFLPLFSTVFFYSRLTTLIEVGVILLILLGTLLCYDGARKNFKWLLLYYFICFLYLVLNYNHSLNFHSLVPNNFNYNFLSESLTIIKLVMPMTFIYSLYYQKINYKKYYLVLKVWTVLIAGSIIISNIFKFSLGSYSDNFININIFEWNLNSYYQDTASKGLFVYANQIAIWLLLLLLIFLYEFINGKKGIIYLLLLVIAMIMLGTRVSTYGAILAIILIFLINLIFFHKKSNVIFFVFLILLWGLLYYVSPCKNRSKELSNVHEVYEDKVSKSNWIRKMLAKFVVEDADEVVESSTVEEVVLLEKIQYVYDNYNENYLPRRFFEENYPIIYDEDFWYNYVKDNPYYTITYRHIEKSIIKRVIEVNDNKWDVLIGIGNSRIQNIVNLEKDFLLHYYAYGLVGSVILLYFYLLIFIKALKNVFKYQTFNSFLTYLVIVVFITGAYLTGNIINSLNIIIAFTFIVSGLFNKEI